MFCMTCGTALQPGMSVCPNCGTAAGSGGNYEARNDPTVLAAGNAPFVETISSPVQPPDRTTPAGPYTPQPFVAGGAYQAAPLPNPMPVTPPPPNPYGSLPPAPPPVQRRGSSRGVIILLVALVALMIIGSGLVYYFSGPYPAQLQANATATAQTRANTQATGTALVIHHDDATATAQAQATLTAQQNQYTQATSGPLILNDSLAQNSASHWDSYNSAANSGCVFTGGTYHAIEQQAGFFNPCFANGPTFGSFTFQVQMTILRGDEGGFIFRASNQNFKGYLLTINVDQTYALYVYYSSSGKNSLTLFSGASSAIKGLNQPNLVTLIAQGKQLTLFVNKQYVDSMSDSTYTSGQIALVADAHSHATEVAYSNAQAWKL